MTYQFNCTLPDEILEPIAEEGLEVYAMDEAQLRDLIAEATVDCYGEDEEFWGFLAALEDELTFPFVATVLGDALQVVGIDGETSSKRRGVMAKVEKNDRYYSFPLSEIEPTEAQATNAEWIAAYKLWSR